MQAKKDARVAEERRRIEQKVKDEFMRLDRADPERALIPLSPKEKVVLPCVNEVARRDESIKVLWVRNTEGQDAIRQTPEAYGLAKCIEQEGRERVAAALGTRWDAFMVKLTDYVVSLNALQRCQLVDGSLNPSPFDGSGREFAVGLAGA